MENEVARALLIKAGYTILGSFYHLDADSFGPLTGLRRLRCRVSLSRGRLSCAFAKLAVKRCFFLEPSQALFYLPAAQTRPVLLTPPFALSPPTASSATSAHFLRMNLKAAALARKASNLPSNISRTNTAHPVLSLGIPTELICKAFRW